MASAAFSEKSELLQYKVCVEHQTHATRICLKDYKDIQMRVMKSQLNKRHCENSVCSGGSPVSIATGYGLDGRNSIRGRSKKFFSSADHPDRP
jgi:hypothetical protein